MKDVKEFIEKAIQGGWHPTYRTLPHLSKFATDKEVLLDPEAWKAVANVMNWCSEGTADATAEWLAIQMMEQVFRGVTPEEYIKTL